MARDFRFGFSLRDTTSRSSVQTWARRAQDWGYDVLLMRDHLGAPAPLATLQVAAAATETLHVGTFVLNAGFHRPALLAREAATLNDYSDGRLELGLGTGFVRAEFEAAGIPYPTARQRVDHLQQVTEHLTEQVPQVPLLIGGSGDRVLTIAARHASTVALTGSGPLAERVDFVRRAAPDRADAVEFNLFIAGIPIDDSGLPDLTIARTMWPDRTEAELLTAPGVLAGSVPEIARTLREYRDRDGFSYFCVQQPHAAAFADVIAELRRSEAAR